MGAYGGQFAVAKEGIEASDGKLRRQSSAPGGGAAGTPSAAGKKDGKEEEEEKLPKPSRFVIVGVAVSTLFLSLGGFVAIRHPWFACLGRNIISIHDGQE